MVAVLHVFSFPLPSPCLIRRIVKSVVLVYRHPCPSSNKCERCWQIPLRISASTKRGVSMRGPYARTTPQARDAGSATSRYKVVGHVYVIWHTTLTYFSQHFLQGSARSYACCRNLTLDTRMLLCQLSVQTLTKAVRASSASQSPCMDHITPVSRMYASLVACTQRYITKTASTFKL
jgi:hypothetical protein